MTTLTTPERAKVVIEIPTRALTTDTLFKVVSVARAKVLDLAPVPTGKNLVSAYSLTAKANGISIFSFAKPLSLTFTYTDTQIAGFDEATLKIYRWDGTQWLALVSVLNKDINTITTTTDRFSYFAIIGEPVPEEPVPEIAVAELKAKIMEIQQQIIQVLQQLIQLIQARIAELQARLPR